MTINTTEIETLEQLSKLLEDGNMTLTLRRDSGSSSWIATLKMMKRVVQYGVGSNLQEALQDVVRHGSKARPLTTLEQQFEAVMTATALSSQKRWREAADAWDRVAVLSENDKSRAFARTQAEQCRANIDPRTVI